MTTPTAAVSHVMLEAYKKYQLVGLLVHGDKPKTFKVSDTVTNNIVWSLMYICLGQSGPAQVHLPYRGQVPEASVRGLH